MRLEKNHSGVVHSAAMAYVVGRKVLVDVIVLGVIVSRCSGGIYAHIFSLRHFISPLYFERSAIYGLTNGVCSRFLPFNLCLALLLLKF